VHKPDGMIGCLSVSTLLPGIICATTLSWAGICGFSRIKDNRHHWWDVLVGYVVGVVTTLICVSSVIST
jgi:membrane-associated phospholipid phosphatase